MGGRAHVPKKFPQSHIHACVHAQSCPTLCNPMDHSPPGSSVHEILQARILEWVAISFSRMIKVDQVFQKARISFQENT